MDAKHTPGPWALDRENMEVFYDDKDVCPLVATLANDWVSEEQCAADGLLIAAAPEMLIELVEVEAFLRRLGWMQDADRIAALIAKATVHAPDYSENGRDCPKCDGCGVVVVEDGRNVGSTENRVAELPSLPIAKPFAQG